MMQVELLLLLGSICRLYIIKNEINRLAPSTDKAHDQKHVMIQQMFPSTAMQAKTKTGTQISDVSAWVLGLGFKGGEGRGRDLGPEAGLLGDGGEDGPDARLGLLDRLVGELARHRAHLVVGDGGLGRRGRAAGGLVLGRRLGRHHELAGRVRRHCAGAADPASRAARRAPWRGRGREAPGSREGTAERERSAGRGTGGWGTGTLGELVSGVRATGCGGSLAGLQISRGGRGINRGDLRG